MKNKDLLYEEPNIIVLAGKEFDISNIPSGKVLRAASMYNAAQQYFNDNKEGSTLTIAESYLKKLVDVALFIIRPYFTWNKLKLWIQTHLITRSWILKRTNKAQLDNFLEIAFEPIVGKKDKKKQTDMMEKMAGAAMKMQEAEPEAFKKLCQSFAVAMGGA
jgi:hypothetical protein